MLDWQLLAQCKFQDEYLQIFTAASSKLLRHFSSRYTISTGQTELESWWVLEQAYVSFCTTKSFAESYIFKLRYVRWIFRFNEKRRTLIQVTQENHSVTMERGSFRLLRLHANRLVEGPTWRIEKANARVRVQCGQVLCGPPQKHMNN